jgi:hypothetical protein
VGKEDPTLTPIPSPGRAGLRPPKGPLRTRRHRSFGPQAGEGCPSADGQGEGFLPQGSRSKASGQVPPWAIHIAPLTGLKAAAENTGTSSTNLRFRTLEGALRMAFYYINGHFQKGSLNRVEDLSVSRVNTRKRNLTGGSRQPLPSRRKGGES